MDAVFKSSYKTDEATWNVFLETYCECAIWFSLNGGGDETILDSVLKITRVLVAADRFPELLGRIEFSAFPKSVAGFIVKTAARMSGEVVGVLFERVFDEVKGSLESTKLGVNSERVGLLLNSMNLSAIACGDDNVITSVKGLFEKVQSLSLAQLNSGGISFLSNASEYPRV
jgi:hypothetical protein